MGQIAYLQKVASRLQHFYARAVADWMDAIGKASGGAYTPQELANDLLANSARGVEAWLSLLTDGGAPLVPTVSINETASTVKNKGTSSTAYLDRPLEPPAVLSCTCPLVLLGQTAAVNPVNAGVAFTSAWLEEIKVTVRAQKTSASSPNPTAGLYVGGVFDPAGVVVANIFLNVR